jgi:translation initiation factor eIF-2B subunit gamma
LFCPAPVSGSPDSSSSGGKDKAKRPSQCNIVGLDPTRQFLLHVSGEDEDDIVVNNSVVADFGFLDI